MIDRARDPLAGLTIQEAAELLGVSEDVVRRMVASGELRGRRAGARWVVSRQAVADWWAADGEVRGVVVRLRRRTG